jgi:hypothetical protein
MQARRQERLGGADMQAKRGCKGEQKAGRQGGGRSITHVRRNVTVLHLLQQAFAVCYEGALVGR